MKQWALCALGIVSIVQLGYGSVCVNGTLSSYVALGSGGCTIDGNTLSDFEVLSGISGAAPISPAQIAITPLGGTFNPGLTAAVDTSASAGMLLEAFFTYRISGGSYAKSSVSLAGSSATGDGAVTDVQNFCAGGTFGPDGISDCLGTPGSLLVLNGGDDQTAFSPVSLLSVTDDFTLDGGTAGSARGGNITDRLTAVPEPFGFLLTALGLALALGTKFSERTL